jgi:hypothetical protein
LVQIRVRVLFFRSLAFSFRMGATTVAQIVKETVKIIWETWGNPPTTTVTDGKTNPMKRSPEHP